MTSALSSCFFAVSPYTRMSCTAPEALSELQHCPIRQLPLLSGRQRLRQGPTHVGVVFRLSVPCPAVDSDGLFVGGGEMTAVHRKLDLAIRPLGAAVLIVHVGRDGIGDHHIGGNVLALIRIRDGVDDFVAGRHRGLDLRGGFVAVLVQHGDTEENKHNQQGKHNTNQKRSRYCGGAHRQEAGQAHPHGFFRQLRHTSRSCVFTVVLVGRSCFVLLFFFFFFCVLFVLVLFCFFFFGIGISGLN